MRIADGALVAAVGLATLLPFLGETRDVATHELRHAEVAREMAESGRILVPTLLGREYADKPPVMHAMVAALFRLAGTPTLQLARVPSMVAGVGGAIALYGIGCAVADRHAALLAATAVLGSLDYRRMARIARPDMLFVAAILVACLLLLRAMRAAGSARRGGRFAVAGAFAGLATVTKGPLGVLVPGLLAIAVRRRPEVGRPSAREWVLVFAGIAAVLAAWAGALWLGGRGAYLHRVLTQPDLRGADPDPGSRWGYAGALLIGFMPFTFLLPALVRDVRRHGIGAALAVVLVLLVVLTVVPKKRPHYLLPVYPFLALALAEAVGRNGETPRLRRATIALAAASLVAGPLYYAVPPRWLAAGEEPKLIVGRRVLALVEPGRPIVCMDELAESIAFQGGRTGVSEVPEIGGVIRTAERNGTGGYVIVPDGREDDLLAAAAGRLRLEPVARAEVPVHHRVRAWRVYRVAP